MGYTVHTTPWPEIFVAFAQGHPLEEIAQGFNIAVQTLQKKIKAENWDELKSEVFKSVGNPMPLQTVLGPGAGLPAEVNERNDLPTVVRAKFAALQENRRHNLVQAQRMRACIDKLLDKLEKSELKIEQLFSAKGVVTRATRELNFQDLVALATYTKMVQDMTYRALGDAVAGEKGQDKSPSQQAQPPIQIILPNIISMPREERAKYREYFLTGKGEAPPGMKAIDVKSEVTQAPTSETGSANTEENTLSDHTPPASGEPPSESEG